MAVKIIKYSQELDVRNIESLPAGTGAKFLEVIDGLGDEYVAVQWRRKIPAKIEQGRSFIEF